MSYWLMTRSMEPLGRPAPVAKRTLQRKCDGCHKKKPELQRSAIGPAPQSVPPIVNEVLRSPGSPLDRTSRDFFEPRFAHDFSSVRVHTDARSAKSAQAVDALAYTVGQDVVFNLGEYKPETNRGKRLLAHELTHVTQQGNAVDLPQGIASSDSPAERQAHAMSNDTPVRASPGLIHRQKKTSPAPAPEASKQDQTTESKPKQDAQQKQPETPKEKDLKTRVQEWLDQEDFHLPLVLDARPKPPEQWHAFYSDQRLNLTQITDETWNVLNQVTPGIKRGDVWQYVYQYYQQKERDISASSWQWVVQALYTPSYTLASSAPVIGNNWQNPLQASLGRTYAAHKQGYGGIEHQFAFTGSFFNLGSGHSDWFQNALLQYQISAVTPLGSDFRLGDKWASAQASIFAQLAAGIGANWDASASGDRKAYIGFLFQPGLGGQVTVNIGWFQIVAQGTVVYSYMSKTAQEGSKPTNTLGFQPGLGIGGQF